MPDLSLTRYVVLDLETEGLDPFTDQILEVAAIAIDSDYSELARHHQVVYCPCTRKVTPVVEAMHTHNGLWAECSGVETSELQADLALSHFLSSLLQPPQSIILMGSGVHFDHEFLTQRFPISATWLHYRIMDVGGLARWLEDFGLPVHKPRLKPHRAMLDCELALDQARALRALVQAK